MASTKELLRRPSARMPEAGKVGGRKFTSNEKRVDVTAKNSHEMGRRFAKGTKKPGKGDRW